MSPHTRLWYHFKTWWHNEPPYKTLVSIKNVKAQWDPIQDFLVSFQNVKAQWAPIQDFLVSIKNVKAQWATRQDTEYRYRLIMGILSVLILIQEAPRFQKGRFCWFFLAFIIFSTNFDEQKKVKFSYIVCQQIFDEFYLFNFLHFVDQT